MRKLRPLSWVIIAVNLLFVWWIIAGVGGAVAESCTDLTGDELSACEAGTAIGAGLGTMFILFFWVVIDIILLVIFLVTNKKGRECPSCGRKVKVGKTECEKCGHNFKQS